MDDVVIIDQAAFRACRPAVVEKLRGSKIDGIFALDCFNETKLKQVTANFKSKAAIGSNQRFYNNRDAKPPRARLAVHQTYHEKLMREVVACLNKLNASNIDVIAGKILKVIDANNIGDVVRHVVEKSCTNGTYIEHFFALLEKLGNKEVVKECIAESVARFLDDFGETVSELEKIEYSDYDQFCDFVKRKSVLQAKNKLVMHYEGGAVAEFFGRLIDMIKPELAPHVQDLLVQLVADHMGQGSEALYLQLGQSLGRLDPFISSKSRFLLQDVMKETESKHKVGFFVCKARQRGKVSRGT